MAPEQHAIGIDFGTTNSSVAFLDGGDLRTVQFPTAQGSTRSSRSVLYLEQLRSGRKPISVWTGPAAIEHYLQHDSLDDEVRGRLMQSLKSYLSSRTLTGTEVFGRPYKLEELVARMLSDLRKRASDFLGFPVTRAVAGRPVRFVGSESEDDDAFALGRLRNAFEIAGFTDVSFAMEPVAAAYAYASSLGKPETVLIGDFGGGTTDFSLLRIGPGTRSVIGNSGIGMAGDAFDAAIVRRLISPALGSDSMARSLDKILPALPAWIYANLERWHTLSFLRTRNVMEMLRTTRKRALEPEKIAALIAVVEHDLGYRLHGSVQRVKVALSEQAETEFELDAEVLHLRAPVTRAQFEGWIAPVLRAMATCVDDLLSRCALTTGEVDRVFLTGGTSLVPAVRQIFTSRFGEERVRSGDAFTSVAEGLARVASEQAQSA